MSSTADEIIYVRSIEDIERLGRKLPDSFIVIDSSVVGFIAFERPWRISIVLRDGRKIVVESDIYEDAKSCRSVECIYENTYLNKWIED